MFIKNSISYLISKSLAGLILLLSVVVFTRILRPEEYAVYSILISAMNIIYAVFFLWLSLSFTRFYEIYRRDPSVLYSSVFSSFIIIVFILFALKVFFQKVVLFKINFEFSYVLFLLVISYAWYDLNLRVANVNQRTSVYGKIVIYRALVGFLVGLTLYYLYGVNGIFVAFIVSSIILPFLFIKPNPLVVSLNKVDITLLKALFIYGLPLALSSGLIMIVDFSDRFLIASLIGKEESGIYSASYDFVLQTLGFLIGVFYLSFFPIINNLHESNNLKSFDEQFTYYANIILMVSLPVSLAYVFLADGFSNLFLGGSFRSISGEIIPIITLGVLIGNVKAYLIDLVFFLRKKTLIQVIPSGVVALINVSLNLIWIPKFGTVGAAYATLVSFIIGMFLSVIFAVHYKMMPRLDKDTYKVLLAALVMCLYLLIIKPTESYGLVTFLVILSSALLIYFVVSWCLNTLKFRDMFATILNKIYKE